MAETGICPLIGEVIARGLLPCDQLANLAAHSSWKTLMPLLASIPNSTTASFLQLDNFEFAGDYAVIGYRAQDSIAVGIRKADFEKDYPPVHVSENIEHRSWRMEFSSFKDWIEIVLLWILVNEGRGTLGYAGKGGKAALRRLDKHSIKVAENSTVVGIQFRVYQESAVLCLAGNAVYAWAVGPDQWADMEKLAGDAWDYCSLDDG